MNTIFETQTQRLDTTGTPEISFDHHPVARYHNSCNEYMFFNMLLQGKQARHLASIMDGLTMDGLTNTY